MAETTLRVHASCTCQNPPMDIPLHPATDGIQRRHQAQALPSQAPRPASLPAAAHASHS
jgi:hypothetical protein